MAHDVQFSLPQRSLGPTDIEFAIKKDGKMLGTLKISKGAVVWFARGTSYGHKMSWSKFDKMMQENASQQEER